MINLANDLELKAAYAHVKKYVKSKMLFLEVGCGPARLSCLLAKEGIKIAGVDLSLNALILANKLFKRESINGFFSACDVNGEKSENNVYCKWLRDK